jgi:diaminobutyrate-2-oxoglutarate transaminase
MNTFDLLESEVRIYSRQFPVVFTKGVGSKMFDEQGKGYVDFFSGAGALNYGHNNERMKKRLIEYLESDLITHSLDMSTPAKREFLERFNTVILAPRKLKYKLQFCGPTGTNAVEAALKLARKVTGRQTAVFFMDAYHGLSLGSLAVTGNHSKRRSAGVPLHYSLPMPYDGDLGPHIDTLDYLEHFLRNANSGVDLPAAVIVETIQAEGGVKVARFEWLRRLSALTKSYGIMLIVDDIQVGCGRTGAFFSFEPAGISPDMICLSKSISGFGLPMALLLIRPEHDLWQPGEHTGTFRGNNLAFVTATEALTYWENDEFSESVLRMSDHARALLESIVKNHPEGRIWTRGRGLIQGLGIEGKGMAEQIRQAAFKRGVIIETSGVRSEVIKLLPPLNISREELEEGISRLAESVEITLNEERLSRAVQHVD